MRWNDIASSPFDLPYYIGREEPLRGEPTAVISEEGLALAEPLYESIVPWIDRMIPILGLDSIAINDHSIADLIGELVVHFTDAGFVISIPISLILLLIALRAKGMLSNHIHIEATETIYVNDSVDVIDELIDGSCN